MAHQNVSWKSLGLINLNEYLVRSRTVLLYRAVPEVMTFQSATTDDEFKVAFKKASVDSNKPIVLVFYASWCEECKEHDLQKLCLNFPNVAFITIDVDTCSVRVNKLKSFIS